MTFDDCCNDADLQRLREQRLEQLKREATMDVQLYGSLTPVSQEKEVVHMISHTAKLVIHFRMPSFRRCDIMSEHLVILARKYPKTRFIEVNAVDMAFLVAKFKVKVLPCLIAIGFGQLLDKIVGFDDFGGSDDFPIALLEQRLQLSGALPQPAKASNSRHADSEEDEED